VSVKTAADFIKAGSLALGVGADLVDTKAIRDGNARAVTDKALEYVRVVQEARASA
jgi:2-dehydro-3-deoxyphosphogluconate aldolase/(4S)-4-hydroxy-2-oxoglutarate aldolase